MKIKNLFCNDLKACFLFSYLTSKLSSYFFAKTDKLEKDERYRFIIEKDHKAVKGKNILQKMITV